MRTFSTADEQGKQQQSAAEGGNGAAAPAEEADKAAAEGSASQEEPAPEVSEKDNLIAKQEEEIATLKDRLLRTLADMENLRERSARQTENAHKFAVQGFVKDVLDVPDNLERALESVKGAMYKGAGAEGQISEDIDRDQALALLKSFVEGVEMTDKIMLQVFSRHGIERVMPMGEAFDPNLHNAMFEVPDPTKAAGTVAHVVKAGYTLHGRVVRPAHVGVVKAQDT